MKKILLFAFLFVSVFANAQNVKNDGQPYDVHRRDCLCILKEREKQYEYYRNKLLTFE